MPVVNIPGVGQVNFPPEMSEEQINTEAARLHRESQAVAPQQPQEEIGSGTAFLRGAGGTLLDNAIGGIDSLARRAITTVFPDPLPGQPDVRPQGVQDLLAQERVLPLPRGQDLIPGLAEAQEQAPVATGAGDILGEGLSLLGVRAPVKRAQRDALEAAARAPAPAPAVPVPPEARMSLAPFVRRAVDETLARPSVKALARGAGRSLETGLEGALLATVQSGDPVEVGAASAAGQLAGSIALSGAKFGFKHPGATLGMTALGLAALAQTGKSLLPGGKDRILESIEFGFDKVALGVAMAAMAGMAGAGRIDSRNFPVFMDSLTSIPRGVALSVVRDVMDESERGVDTTERALLHLTADPLAFNTSQRNALEQAFKKGTFGQTVNRLVETDPRFASVLDKEPGFRAEEERNKPLQGLTRGQRRQLENATKRRQL